MTETELNNYLCTIRKRIIVKYFHWFGNQSLSNQDVIALLPHEFTLKSRTSRTSKPRRIFREGLEVDALSIIANSDRVEPKATIEARALLAKLRSR